MRGGRGGSLMMDGDDGEGIPMEMDLTLNGPPPASDDDDVDDDCSAGESQQGIETLKEKIARYAKIILPHIGLVLLLTVYTILGAGAFHIIELPHESRMKTEIIQTLYDTRRDYMDRLWNASRCQFLCRTAEKGDWMDADEWTEIGEEYWMAIINQSYNASNTQIVKTNHIFGNLLDDVWTFEASIFFATTVITTIGYGQMAPMTTVGRVFCIGFGLFGIPLLLVTIADIGKFLSDLLSFLHRSYHAFARRIRKQSRRFSKRKRTQSDSSPDKLDTGPNLHIPDDDSEASSEDELRIPIVMVMVVLVGYTSLGGLLFQWFEGWDYFEAFYFCFITMATIGFGDFVPTKQVYMFFTMAYIVVGLALATMCIDLAGTEYIRKIHFVGQKIENAKEVMGVGLTAGGHLLKHTGYDFIRTAGGRLAVVGRGGNFDGFMEDDMLRERNILYEPISPRVLKHIKANIKLMPNEISNKDGYVLQNRVFNQLPVRRTYHLSPELIQRYYRPASLRRAGSEPVLLIAPFLLKETKI